ELLGGRVIRIELVREVGELLRPRDVPLELVPDRLLHQLVAPARADVEETLVLRPLRERVARQIADVVPGRVVEALPLERVLGVRDRVLERPRRRARAEELHAVRDGAGDPNAEQETEENDRGGPPARRAPRRERLVHAL